MFEMLNVKLICFLGKIYTHFGKIKKSVLELAIIKILTNNFVIITSSYSFFKYQ